MTRDFHELALEEYDEHIAYYHRIDPALAARFQDEVERLLHLVQANPALFRKRPPGYRRANLKIFNHYVVYLVRGKSFYVIAIGHGSQQPEYWLDRLSDSP